jgi:hypothetical protein
MIMTFYIHRTLAENDSATIYLPPILPIPKKHSDPDRPANSKRAQPSQGPIQGNAHVFISLPGRSQKTGCKWKIFAKSLPSQNDFWVLRQHPNMEHHQHNHPPSINPVAHPIHRRRTTIVNSAIESASRRVGIRARDVPSIVQEQHPDAFLTARNVYNVRANITCEQLEGYTSTAAFIKLFNEQDIPYMVK